MPSDDGIYFSEGTGDKIFRMFSSGVFDDMFNKNKTKCDRSYWFFCKKSGSLLALHISIGRNM